ncbi:MAG: hypothetical protein AAFP90_01385, partial [Planctomycetota bacterium]
MNTLRCTTAGTTRRILAKIAHHCAVPTLGQLLFLIATIIGVALVASSLVRDWFSVPVAITPMVPGVTPYYRAAGGALMVLLIGGWMHRFQWNMFCSLVAAAGIAISLSYPTAVLVFDPIVAAEASWLHQQHDNLVWLGGDIPLSSESGTSMLGLRLYVSDIQRRLAVIDLPSWTPGQFGLHRVASLLGWLGYSNSFCQFACSGWTMSVSGWILLWMVALMRRCRLNRSRAAVGVALIGVCAAMTTFVGWFYPMSAASNLRAAEQFASCREYHQSLNQLLLAQQKVPVLSQDTRWIAQRGLLERRLGIDSPHARLYQASITEHRDKYDQAMETFEALATAQDPGVRREAVRALMRDGIHDLNSGRYALAQSRLLQVLRHQPANLKALYAAQLIAVRLQDETTARQIEKQIHWACDQYRFTSQIGSGRIVRSVAARNVLLASIAESGNLDSGNTTTDSNLAAKRQWEILRQMRDPSNIKFDEPNEKPSIHNADISIPQ